LFDDDRVERGGTTGTSETNVGIGGGDGVFFRHMFVVASLTFGLRWEMGLQYRYYLIKIPGWNVDL
jgi:hypothetical protein